MANFGPEPQLTIEHTNQCGRNQHLHSLARDGMTPKVRNPSILQANGLNMFEQHALNANESFWIFIVLR